MTSIVFLSLLFALWRVVDGNWKETVAARHPFRLSWTLLGAALIVIVCLGEVRPWGLAVAFALPFLAVYNRGYDNAGDPARGWNSFEDMLLRPWPIAFLPWISWSWTLWTDVPFSAWPCISVLIIICVNVVQPLLRPALGRRLGGHWPNRLVEAIEGAGLGAALAVLP